MGYATPASQLLILVGLMANPGCARPNPAFGDAESGSPPGAPTETEPSASTTGSSSGAPSSTSSTTSGASGSGSSGRSVFDLGVEPELLFIDDDAADFAAGTSTTLLWQDGALQIEEGSATGEHISRVFAAGTPVRWDRLQWAPRGPYGVGLSDPGVDDRGTAYAEGGISSSDLDLLLRLDFDDNIPPGAMIPDASGNANHGEHVGPAATRTRGVFGSAYTSSSVETHVLLPRDALQIGTSAYTWSAWFRIDSCQASTFLSLDDPNNGIGTTSAWFMCSRSGVEPCGDGGHLLASAPGVTSSFCGDTQIDDNAWHHVVYRRAIDNEANYRMFVDGEPDSEPRTFTTVQDLTPAGPEVMAFAGQPLPTNGAPEQGGIGTYDEVAMWRRALSEEEIRNLYLRGARGLRMQVRACAEADCSDAPPFIGPDGTDTSAFLDPGPQTGHSVELDGFVGAALQYRMTVLRPQTAASPAVERVQVTATPL